MASNLSSRRQIRPVDAAGRDRSDPAADSQARPARPAPSHFTAATDFLRQLDPVDRKDLLNLARRIAVNKGRFVYRTGDRKRAVYILLRGRVKVFKETFEGREVILWFCFPGEIFGMAPVPEGKGRQVNTQACEDSEIAVIGDADFDRFLNDRPRVSRLCIRAMSARLGVLSKILVYLVSDDAHTRIAKLILQLGARYGVKSGRQTLIQMPLTHQEIADMTGANRQTVTRILGDLRREGALMIVNRRIRIESAELLNNAVRKAAR